MNGIQHGGLSFESKCSGSAQDGGFPRHMHEAYELYYFLEGDADYVVGDKLYPLAPHTLLLIRPAVYHFPVLHAEAPYRRMVLNFTEELVPAPLVPVLRAADVSRRAPPAGRLGQLFAGVERAAQHYAEADALLALRESLTLILLELKYETPAREDGADVLHPRLGEVLRHIDAHLAEPMSVTEIAAAFFVSPSWLTHTFAQYLHIGVMQYVNSKKILRAQQLIRAGMPPTQAAQECGFSGYSTFFRLYRSILGTSPAQDKRPPDAPSFGGER